ncbi:hypothetical protein CF327_g2104 [Tilletia walkeri]|uniref:Uncharacterized protein n=1 Tax=Tilletia walkeri TaxID=117179 RepID=A0A8X7NFC1_9BASI|nr:hypothetical protein CF327_g2104 [Tilletia walkeri]KAE8271385.1 hypothetical protein A4X09_0g977 [Tilletia walkeri]
MRLPTILATLSLIAASACAAVSDPKAAQALAPLGRADVPYPRCQPYEGYYASGPTGILLPTPGTQVTPGVPFQFAFCSDAYFKTSTRQIQVGFQDTEGRIHLIGTNVGPGGYYGTFTFTRAQAGTGYLVVFESQNAYGGGLGGLLFGVQLNVTPKHARQID